MKIRRSVGALVMLHLIVEVTLSLVTSEPTASYIDGLGRLTAIAAVIALMNVEIMERIGYPNYVGRILGAWYVGAAVALVVPGVPRVKEWAYAGVIFAMTGAFASHIFSGDAIADFAPSLVLILLTVASYSLRPVNRRLLFAPAC